MLLILLIIIILYMCYCYCWGKACHTSKTWYYFSTILLYSCSLNYWYLELLVCAFWFPFSWTRYNIITTCEVMAKQVTYCRNVAFSCGFYKEDVFRKSWKIKRASSATQSTNIIYYILNICIKCNFYKEGVNTTLNNLKK